MLRVGLSKPDKNAFSQLIARHDSPGLYSHAALWFSADLVFEAHCDFGVRFKSYVPDPSRWDFFQLPLLSTEQMELIHRFCALHAGDGYDLCGVLAFKTRIIKEDAKKWFCSELVVAALQAGGVISPKHKPFAYTPNALAMLLPDLLDANLNHEGEKARREEASGNWGEQAELGGQK